VATEARVRIASFDSRIAAEIARARLESLGIRSWVDADDAGGAYPPLSSSGVRLVVDAEDAYRARQALDVDPIEDLPGGDPALEHAPDPSPDAGRRSPLGWFALGLLILALLAWLLACGARGYAQSASHVAHKRSAAAASAAGSSASSFISPSVLCRYTPLGIGCVAQ